jgi:SOS response regulatory protein OraA/RecX
LRSLDGRAFQQKLGQFLLRRGFDFETSRAACRRLWQERLSDQPAEPPG